MWLPLWFTVRSVTLNSSHTLHQNRQQNIHYSSCETDQNWLKCFDNMIFWKCELFTRIELPHSNTPVFYLTFVIIILIHVGFLRYFKKLSLNSTMEPFKQSISWQHHLFHWRSPSRTTIKSNHYVQVFISLFVYCLLWVWKCNQTYSYIIQFCTLFMKPIFPGRQTPVPPRSGTWIVDLSHDPIWAIWLAEASKFHQHHDRMNDLCTFSAGLPMLMLELCFTKIFIVCY